MSSEVGVVEDDGRVGEFREDMLGHDIMWM